MSMFNLLKFTMHCPNCGNLITDWECEFRFGFLNLDTYKIGDTLKWNENGGGLRFPKQRPKDGNYIGEAYAECPVCQKDFWLIVTVNNDRIIDVAIDLARPGYISNDQDVE